MSPKNAYKTYKADTKRVLCWLDITYKAVLRRIPRDRVGARMVLNTTGEMTVNQVIPVAEVIAKYDEAVPRCIFRLIESIIKLRSEANEPFEQIVASKPDPEIKKSNATHKFFIDVFKKAFKILGGEKALSSGRNHVDDDMDTARSQVESRFLALSLEPGEQGEDEENIKEDADTSKVEGQRRKAKVPQTKANLPLDSYGFVEDDDSRLSDYLMATWAVAKEWAYLRAKVRNVWHDVAYGELNGAVAASVSLWAIEMVKQTASLVFADFPGRNSFEMIVNALAYTGPNKLARKFYVMRNGIRIDGPESTARDEMEMEVNVGEQLLIHCYHDLLDFLVDFQQLRNGRPTAKMDSEIRDWDPLMDLQQASREERVKWRRAYTIKWLYDFVNNFSSRAVARSVSKGPEHALENVHRSANGPCDDGQRLFGFKEFAIDITTFAMQKSGTKFQHKILPHHVFQLQCLVDSMTVSRGWSPSVRKGDIVISLPSCFWAKRDIDRFRGPELVFIGSGYLHGGCWELIKRYFINDCCLNKEPERHYLHETVLQQIKCEFCNSLGVTLFHRGFKNMPSSQFTGSSHDSDHKGGSKEGPKKSGNGLYEHSPFLCGAALLDALDLAFKVGMWLWDEIPEPTLAIHLQNMLVKKGYLEEETDLIGKLAGFFRNSFFKDGVVPDSDFQGALRRRMPKTVSGHYRTFQRHSIKKLADIQGVKNNKFFRTMSSLMMWQQNGWDPDLVPEDEIGLDTLLFGLRLSKVKTVIDPQNGERRLEATKLITRAKSKGASEEKLLRFCKGYESINEHTRLTEIDFWKSIVEKEIGNDVPDDILIARATAMAQSASKPVNDRFAEERAWQFQAVKFDIHNDVSGYKPILGFNYIWAANQMYEIFVGVEEKLKEQRNPLYIRAYETGANSPGQNPRLAFTLEALKAKDEECLRILAAEFKKPDLIFVSHVYWRQTDPPKSNAKEWQLVEKSRENEDNCVLM